MEIPYVFVDPKETNEMVSDVASSLEEARRLLSRPEATEEFKKQALRMAWESKKIIDAYYEMQKKIQYLMQQAAEEEEILQKLDKDLLVKCQEVNEMEKEKSTVLREINTSQRNISSTREKLRRVVTCRKDLERRNKISAVQIEADNLKYAHAVSVAEEQKARIDKLVDESPKMTKRNQEEQAIAKLTEEFNKLTDVKKSLNDEEEELTEEIDQQLQLPTNAFIVRFAEMMLRVMDMQKKLDIVQVEHNELEAAENERMRMMKEHGYRDMDCTFMSLDCTFTELSQLEKRKERPAAVVEEETMDSEASNASPTPSDSVAPPRTSDEEVRKAKMNAIDKYVCQQAATRDSNRTESADVSNDESPTLTPQPAARRASHPVEEDQGQDIEVASTVDDCRGSPRGEIEEEEDAEMNETVDENEGAASGVRTKTCSQESAGMEGDEAMDEDREEVDDGDDDDEGNMTMHEEDEGEEGDGDDEMESGVESGRTEDVPSGEVEDEEEQHDPQSQQPEDIGAPNVAMSQKDSQTLQTSNAMEINEESVNQGMSQMMGEAFTGFTFGGDGPEDHLLNISVSSTDPAGDFLTLMEHSSKKKDTGKDTAEAEQPNFSFSMFGAGDAANNEGGDNAFPFDFGGGDANGSGGAGAGDFFSFSGLGGGDNNQDNAGGFSFF